MTIVLTPVVGATTLTLSGVRARCRSFLAAAATWSDALLDGWIGDAVRFYGVEYPLRWRATVTLTTGISEYALAGAGTVSGVLSVEYPVGEDPPVYLLQTPEWRLGYQSNSGVYAVRWGGQALGGVAYDAAIRLGQAPETGESMVVEFLGEHPLPAVGDDSALITVPAMHLEALLAFVDFRAHWALESAEAATISVGSIVLSQLGQEGRLCWRRYKEVMDRLATMVPLAGGRVTWGQLGL